MEKQITILFGYSGLTELLRATSVLFECGQRATRENLRASVWTRHLPDVDLLIRTGVEGDPHLSDLLLPLQISNTQLHFSEILWPSFTERHLDLAFEDFARRPRRKGA